MLNIKVLNKSGMSRPAYKTSGAAGMDLQANLESPIEIAPLERILIPTGLFVEIPPCHEAQIRPRSGLALNHGLTVLNSPGTIDSDYRGEIKVLLVNLSAEKYTVNPQDRIAQMVFAQCEQAVWEEMDALQETERGEGGYGSTGKK